ncbi:hypothetical protein BOTBODRAFT_181997 [Botryobasidium botryosum FD-172 SS1]|uniref:DDE Tnp4 domain-containing protein n=1 Tax=Botryobasidium botryosum (strain FD-172 SS1) TaxID=930990 RepID=A0A067LSH9_BOTB1|nr:hypothetical protein BOTBODRAFT_181997 [Botryobasidium botryosum FD-172 SS1]
MQLPRRARRCKIAGVFIDGTLRKIARPTHNQRIVYNGWKRIHCLKYHTVLTPDGIHSHVFEPIEGRRHDSTLYEQSGLKSHLDQHSWDPDGNLLVIYGDPAYGLQTHLISPFAGLTLLPEQQRWNTKMSRVREAVEWGFGETARQFAFIDYSKNQKAVLSPVGVYYITALLFANAHAILHVSEVPQYFNCQPPTLSEYFHGLPPDNGIDLNIVSGPLWDTTEIYDEAGGGDQLSGDATQREDMQGRLGRPRR